MKERFDYDGLLEVNSDLREQLSDVRATVEALQRESMRRYRRSSSYLADKNAIQKELQRERGFTNRYLKRLHEAEAALDAEREKAKNDATAYRKLSEQWNATDLELSQLKALVRAYLEARKSIDSDLAEQARETLRRALDATTPAGEGEGDTK